MTDLMQRLENYLAAGGLVNPELMDHERVRDLIIDCRDALAQPEQSVCAPAGRSVNWSTEDEKRLDGAIEKAYGKPEQEPWLWIRKKYSFEGAWISNRLPDDPENWDAVYKAPLKREWQGLTSEELVDIVIKHAGSPVGQVFAIEAKMREKNEKST